jgi:hypothetical protein
MTGPFRLLIVLGCMLLLGAPALAQSRAPLQPPRYPQSFTLLPGERASFAFPVTRAGLVQADLQWQGGMLLTLNLTDMTGRSVVASKPMSSPARLTYSATVQDVATGIVWRVGVAYPKGAFTLPATVTATIRFPEVDLAALAKAEPGLTAKPKPPAVRPSAAPAAHQASLARTLAELRQPTQQRITTYKAQAATQFAAVQKSGPPNLASNVTLAQKPALVPTAAQQAAIAAGAPTLLEAVPAKASPGEKVVLHGKNFKVQNGLYQVAFTVRAAYMKTVPTGNPARPVDVIQMKPLVLTAAVESVTQLSTGQQELIAHLPAPPAGEATASYDGNVSLNNATGFVSNVLPFHYEAVIVPILNGVATVPGTPGQQMTLNGGLFASTDTLHLVLNDGKDSIVPSTYGSASSLKFTVPTYSARNDFDAQAYLARVVNGLTFKSQPVRFTLKGTEMDATSLSIREGAMDCPLIISGYGFEAKPTVQFQVGSMVYPGTVSQSTPYAIWAIVPKIGGVSSNTPCKVTVLNAKQTSRTPLTFTYLPTFVHEVMRFCGPPFTTDVQFGEPLTTLTPTYANGFNCGYSIFCGKPGEFVEGEALVLGFHDTSQGFFGGKSGYDDFFARTTLRNGWKLEKVVVTLDPRSTTYGLGGIGAYLADNGIGTSSARIRIRWWGDWGCGVDYCFTAIVTGPFGTSY